MCSSDSLCRRSKEFVNAISQLLFSAVRLVVLVTVLSQQTRDIHPMLVQCWPIVCDSGHTLYQHWVNVCVYWEAIILFDEEEMLVRFSLANAFYPRRLDFLFKCLYSQI